MSTDLFEPFQIFSHLAVETVRENLERFAINNVTLSIEEPVRNLELSRVLDDGDNSFKFIRVEFTSPLVEVYICLFAGNVCQSTPDTTNLGQSEHNFDSSVNIGVEKTKDVLKLLVGLGNN